MLLRGEAAFDWQNETDFGPTVVGQRDSCCIQCLNSEMIDHLK